MYNDFGSRVKRRKLNGKMPTNTTATTESEPDLLDILDNFLISTSNAEHTPSVLRFFVYFLSSGANQVFFREIAMFI